MKYAIGLAGILLLCVGLYLARESVLQATGDFLVLQDNLKPADVIHVISGPDDRTDYGIWLYKQGLGRQLFFTGGWCPTIQGVHAERGKARAIAQGVPPQAIAMDGFQVTSTYSEAVRLKEWLAQRPEPVHSVILVSDPYHMRRAKLAFSWVLGPTIKLQMAPVPFALSPYQRRWWTDAESRRFVQDEYTKIVYYYARYRLSWGPLKAWLASLDRE